MGQQSHGRNVDQNEPYAVACLHILKSGVDLRQWLSMCNKFINLELALHVVADKSWKLGSALNTPESATFPLATCHKLKCFDCQ